MNRDLEKKTWERRQVEALERIAKALEKIGGEDGLLDAMDTRLANIDYTLEQIRDKT